MKKFEKTVRGQTSEVSVLGRGICKSPLKSNREIETKKDMGNQKDRIEKDKLQRIKEEASKLGASYYKFVEPFIISLNDRIGKGSYGEVFKGADTRSGHLVAVKTVSTLNIKKDPEKFYESLKNEIEIMKGLKHPHIVALLEVKKSANNIYLFEQLCNKGSLQQMLSQRKRISETEAVQIIKQLVAGYRYLHEHGIIHRDLKPANILIKDDSYKIADFGFAKCFQSGAELDLIHCSLVGSPIYMCPEILNGQSYSTKSDVWSMGVIFYQMLFGRTPFSAQSLEELVNKVNKKSIRFPTRLCNDRLEIILSGMLKYDPDERSSWKSIFEDEFFADQPRASIKDSLRQAGKSNAGTRLEMSSHVNEIYFQNIKIEQFAIKEEETLLSQVPQNEGARDYSMIAMRYQQKEKQKEIIRRLKEWFLQKRNKAVFLNHLSLKVHNCYNLDLLDIPLPSAEIFILVLAKWECMIAYKCYMQLKEGKLFSSTFTPEDFSLLLNTPIQAKLLEKFKNDFTVMKMFFDELVKKVEAYLTDYSAIRPLSDSLLQVQSICNFNICSKELILAIYSTCLDDMLDAVVRSLSSSRFHPPYPWVSSESNITPQDHRTLLQLFYLLTEATKLKNGELDSLEFSLIYDQEKKMSDEELWNRFTNREV